jgi:hypothetical protein
MVNVTNVVVNEFVMVDITGGYFSRTPAKSSPGGNVSDGSLYVDSLCNMVPNAPECAPTTTTTTVPPTTTQPEPTLGTGNVQFTLRWNSKADLDIAVLDPSNEEINFDHPLSTSGGQLDVHSNSECASAVTNPVENVFWPVGKSLDGLYKVQVRYYDECGTAVGPQRFTLTARIGGVEVALQPVTSGLLAEAGSLNAPRDTVVDHSVVAGPGRQRSAGGLLQEAVPTAGDRRDEHELHRVHARPHRDLIGHEHPWRNGRDSQIVVP